MEWTQLVAYSIYNVTAVPLVPIVFTGSTSSQLTISYNLEINLTLKAIAPSRSNTTANIRLKYGQQCYTKFIKFTNLIMILLSLLLEQQIVDIQIYSYGELLMVMFPTLKVMIVYR